MYKDTSNAKDIGSIGTARQIRMKHFGNNNNIPSSCPGKERACNEVGHDGR